MSDKTEAKAPEQDDQKPVDLQEGVEAKAEPSKDLKVVVSLKGGITTVGVQRPEADPHIESFAHSGLEEVLEEIVPVVERAAAKWADAPKNPAYSRPSPSSGRQQTQQPASGGNSDTEAPILQQTTLF